MPDEPPTDPTPSPESTPIREPGELLHWRVIVAGFGPVGRLVSEQLQLAGLAITIIETNLKTVEQQLRLDKDVIYGDVCDEQVLRNAGLDQADALILAIPDEDMALEACQIARQINPHIFIAARSNYLSKGMLTKAAGADAVVIEEVVTAKAMQRTVLQGLLGDSTDAGL